MIATYSKYIYIYIYQGYIAYITVHTWNIGVMPDPPASIPNALTWPGWYLKRPCITRFWYKYSENFQPFKKLNATQSKLCECPPEVKVCCFIWTSELQEHIRSILFDKNFFHVNKLVQKLLVMLSIWKYKSISLKSLQRILHMQSSYIKMHPSAKKESL